MKVLYISSATTDKTIKEISNKYMKGVAFKTPQQTFDLSIAKGLSEQCNLELMSIPPVKSYPGSSSVFFKKKSEDIKENVSIKYIPLINIIGIKSIGIFIYTLFKMLIWNFKNKKLNKIILLHWPFYPTMLSGLIIKLITKTEVILIVPDLPRYSVEYSQESSKIKNMLTRIVNKIKPEIESEFDGYVFLTKYMGKIINKKNKPSIILEGLISESIKPQKNLLKNKYNKKVIMYAGAVYEKFGIEKLVKAFHIYVKEDCELWIYGNGDFVSKLIKFTEKDSRIKYKGVKFREEILECEIKVSLLVNPRPSKEELTKYSFPSKTLEYMSSGTPFLSTKLKGIPKEYEDYIYWFDDETLEGIGNKLNEIISLDESCLHEFGLKAKEWVMTNKINTFQTKKILELTKRVLKIPT